MGPIRFIVCIVLTALSCGCAEAGVAAHGFEPRDAATALAINRSRESASPAPVTAPQVKADNAEVAKATQPGAQARVVIYSAGLRMVVVSVSESVTSVQHIADTAGGYMQEISGDSITVRVPAEKFQSAIAAIEKLGEVVDRNIKASDITEQMIDLKIRLENAEAARKRLLELVDKMQKTEDLLKVQEQLARVTTDIESMKGKIRYLESQAAMSTIRVDFNSRQPRVASSISNMPFDWVQRLGDGLVAGTLESAPRKPGIFGHGPDFNPPAGFVRYYQSSDYVEAMDVGDLRIKVQRQPNFDEADIGFWSKAARKALLETRSVAITSEKLTGDTAQIAGTREVAGKPYEYLLILRRDRKNIVVIEAWGPKDQFAARKDDLYAMADVSGKGRK